ncbi:hypothetical protein BLNAU_13368 [Blattamonas nauphoetae]|uniref:Uncharacterized protein n=1 Tax=Blattamonas nauphoetae TaxID=2049346 RepID=A0ABQ9XJH5_9EUKA|nr:hypothetical protein BLNAU_13368 [Blattamonas nauphoetae]
MIHQPCITTNFLICKKFLDFINDIETENCIIKLPPHPRHEVARLECVLWDLFLHFYESGDISIVNNFHVRHNNLDPAFADNTPLIVIFLAECISTVDDFEKVRFFPKPSIASIFVKGVTQTCALGRIRVRENSILRTVNAEPVSFLQDILPKIIHRDFEQLLIQNLASYNEWKHFLRYIATKQFTLTDLSFLCLLLFRPYLVSIRTKLQVRAMVAQSNHLLQAVDHTSSNLTLGPPPSISLSADKNHTFQNPPFQDIEKSHFSDTSSNGLKSTISTETELPPSVESVSSDASRTGKSLSDHSSEPSLASSVQPSISITTDLQSTPSAFSLAHSSFIHQATLNIITTIHSLLSAPVRISPFNQFRMPSALDFETDLYFQRFNRNEDHIPDLDLTETFSPDLFDEEDDFILITTLWRCEAVLDETRSSSCILQQTEFITKLISALHSDNSVIRDRSFLVFEDLILLIDCPDPLSPPYSSLRNAFRDGTETEQVALVRLWILWMHKESWKTSHDRKMKESDFDFEGLLSVDLTNHIYSNAFLRFVMCLINADLDKTSSWMEMSLDWRVNFLLRFHNSNDFLGRSGGTYVCYFACMLTHYHGLPFPTAYLDFIENTPDFPVLSELRGIHPTILLNHTSLPLSTRRSLVPYDLLFERHLRLDASLFVISRRIIRSIKSKWLLNYPLVGIHSLLLRCFHLDFTDDETCELGASIFMSILLSDHPQQHDYVHGCYLFAFFPPPLVIPSLVISIDAILTNPIITSVFIIIFQSLLLHTAPFGDCVSLSKILPSIFPHLRLSIVADHLILLLARIVFVLSWLNLPQHFDLPLLSLNPSHSIHTQILSTFTKNSRQVIFEAASPDNSVFDSVWDFFVIIEGIRDPSRAFIAHSDHTNPSTRRMYLEILPSLITLSIPAHRSIFLEMLHRLVVVSPHTFRLNLISKGVIDSILFAVSTSSNLEDYENGIAVIGILLDAIRRDHLRRIEKHLSLTDPDEPIIRFNRLKMKSIEMILVLTETLSKILFISDENSACCGLSVENIIAANNLTKDIANYGPNSEYSSSSTPTNPCSLFHSKQDDDRKQGALHRILCDETSPEGIHSTIRGAAERDGWTLELEMRWRLRQTVASPIESRHCSGWKTLCPHLTHLPPPNWLEGGLKREGGWILQDTPRLSRRVHPRWRSETLHTRRMHFPLSLLLHSHLSHSSSTISPSAPSALPSLCPPQLSIHPLLVPSV